MRHSLRARLCLAASALGLSMSAALAADPTGFWLVDGGYAHVRIENCNGKMWGVVAWEQTPGGIDKNNPDPAQRTRPTLGLPVLKAMIPAKPNRWDGEIYNTEDGRTYTSSISLVDDDTLRVQGCVLGFLCGGQNWTRVKNAAPAPQAAATPAKPAARGKSSAVPQANAATPGDPATQPTKDLCQTIAQTYGSGAARAQSNSQNTGSSSWRW